MLIPFLLFASALGVLSCASKKSARPSPPLPVAPSATADDPLEPLSCPSIKTTLPHSFANKLDLRFSPSMLEPAEGAWSQDDIVALERKLIVNPGILQRVWQYYGPDSAAVSGYPFSFTSHGKTYSRIRVDVYAQQDCCRNKC